MPAHPTRRRPLLAGLAGLAAAPYGFRAAKAQSAWTPARPLRLIVPFAAGSGTDAVARIVAEMLGADDGPPGSGNWHANSNPPYDGIPAARTRATVLSSSSSRRKASTSRSRSAA